MHPARVTSHIGRLDGLRVTALLVLAILGAGWGTDARAWWNNDWAFRKEISFDLSPKGADIAGSPTDVPVLIRLSLGNFQYFNDTAPDGADLRFIAADDKTPLKFHIERYDPKAQMAFVWVRVPRLTGGATADKIFLYYGNKKAAAGADSAGTYDVNQALVYHFGAAPGTPQDVTAYKTEPKTFSAEVNPASLIASGGRFSGGQSISIPANGALRLAAGKGLTLSAWVRIEGPQAQAVVAELAESGHEFTLGIAGTRPFVHYLGGSGPPVTVTAPEDLSTAEWHHLAARIGDGQLALIVDGVEAAQAPATAADIGGSLTVGGSAAGSAFLAGELDELEVANVARSTDWLKAAARSQGPVAPLVVYGGDTQNENGGNTSYFATTLRNVTVDGWVIIAVLAVLFVASFLIMGGKLIYLSRVAGANARFLEAFRKLPDAGSRLEAGDEAFGSSTLWQLYDHGMRETLKRVEGQAAGADRVKTLSAQSIEAIRATMDASLTRGSQRLSAQMVWLTISIAGGPFLGLLGTVVGVMITFAAIAASGDVNVNAIAPGIAAALVATVAGLGVAIPCLFGYNYLNTRIKEMLADMRVFVDEFVTRVAETYS
jgi:biopolymer transport protein ExbB